MSILPFQIPDKVVTKENNKFHGSFEFKPLERGYGVTIGNALRRVLISSLEGYAIVGVRFSNVIHEFSCIEGVLEDVTQIVLNLKQVRFKSSLENPEQKIEIHISSSDKFLAGDIGKFTSSFKILNPDLVIFNLNTSVDIRMNLFLRKGRGYLPAEEIDSNENLVGYIPMDAVFTPIKKVSYDVENTRIGKHTDYESLSIDILTDGSIDPVEAIKNASDILTRYLLLFSGKKEDNEIPIEDKKAKKIDDKFMRISKNLQITIEELNLSARSLNCLKAYNITTLEEIVSKDESYFLNIRNFGRKSMEEIRKIINDKGLNFAMDVAKYRLKEDNIEL